MGQEQQWWWLRPRFHSDFQLCVGVCVHPCVGGEHVTPFGKLCVQGLPRVMAAGCSKSGRGVGAEGEGCCGIACCLAQSVGLMCCGLLCSVVLHTAQEFGILHV